MMYCCLGSQNDFFEMRSPSPFWIRWEGGLESYDRVQYIWIDDPLFLRIAIRKENCGTTYFKIEKNSVIVVVISFFQSPILEPEGIFFEDDRHKKRCCGPDHHM